MLREGAGAWQKPDSFVVTHAPVLTGVYNGNPQAEALITGRMDGWAAHAKKDAEGRLVFPNEINWNTDAERKGDGGGLDTPLQSAWAAWRFTGDDKYLAPIRSRLAVAGPKLLAQFNENRSDEHTSARQSLMRISYAVFCLQKTNIIYH